MTESSLMDEMNDFFDRKGSEQDAEMGVSVIRPSTNDNNANLELFYRKLEELGMNLDELKPILECKDNTLILSGAGSGKTTALILKIIRDLISGDMMKMTTVNSVYGTTQVQVPANILVATFLKTGALELQASFREWCQKLGIVGLDYTNINFSTIHSEVKNALSQMGVRVEVLEDSLSMVRSVMNKYGIRSVSATARSASIDEVSDVASIVAYARNRLDNERYNQALMGDYRMDAILLDAVLNDLKLHRRASGKLDFEDMQEMLLEALQMNQNVRDFIASRYEYVYVDEFQDTSQLQYEILKYYFAGAKRVIVIGDDDQCLVEGTLVDTDSGIKPIEEVKAGDKVLSGNGRGHSGYYMVDHVSKKLVQEEIMVIETLSGKQIRGTKNHIGFAKIVPDADVHSTPQTGSERHKISFSMFSSNQVDWAGVSKSELSANTSNEAFADILREHLAVSLKRTTHTGSPYYNGRKTTNDTDRQVKSIKEIRKECAEKGIYLEVNQNAKLTDSKFDFTPLGNFIEGMIVPIVLEDGSVIEDEVVSVSTEMYEGYVYDLSVPETRNFSANGVLVHNCIYSWRGADNQIIGHRFVEDINPTILVLTVNYRCKANILNPVIPSIELNSNRHEKKLRSHSEGGEVNIIMNGDVNQMVSSMKQDLTNNMKVGILARVNADLLIPAMILELDGGVEFGLSKSVNMQGRMARQIFGVIDLVTKRVNAEFEGYLRLFLPRYNWYEAEKLYNVLLTNRSMNLYNIPIEDLQHSVPNLAPFIKGLREAKAQDGVGAYLYILGMLEQKTFVGKSLYAQKARDLLRFVKKIVLEHNSVKDLTINEIDSLFNQVLPEKLNRRIKYGKDTFVKLTTVHEAKGKEWDSVYIWNNVEGSFPNKVGNREMTEAEFEEERRVHYIAWTRAKTKLTVYSSTSNMGTFLKECDMSTVKTIEEQKSDMNKVFKKAQPSDKPQLQTDTLLRSYIARMHEVGGLLDERVANIEIVTNNYPFEMLVERLERQFGVHLTQDSEDGDELLTEFFRTLSDEIFNRGGYRA